MKGVIIKCAHGFVYIFIIGLFFGYLLGYMDGAMLNYFSLKKPTYT